MRGARGNLNREDTNGDKIFDIVDSIIKPGKQIYLGSAGFLRSADGSIRRWHLAEPACSRERLTTVPSVELLLLLIQDEKSNYEKINSKVQNPGYSGKECSLASLSTQTPHIIPRSDHKEIALSSSSLQGRIVYTINWHPGRDTHKLTGRAEYVSANDVTQDRYQDLFSDRIVIIGGSNEESRDIYNTPFGPMPGAVVLINAIESLSTYDQLGEPPPWSLELIIGIIIAFIIAYILEKFRIELGDFIVYVLVFLLTFIISIVLLYFFSVWYGVSGVIAGGVAHFIWKAGQNIVYYILEDPPNWWAALHAERS